MTRRVGHPFKGADREVDGDRRLSRSVVSEFLHLLDGAEKIFRIRSTPSDRLLAFIGDLRSLLARHKNRDADEVLDAIRLALQEAPGTSHEGTPQSEPSTDAGATAHEGAPQSESSIGLAAYQHLTKDDVRSKLADPDTDRRTLMMIAQHRFGASGGTLSRLSRDALREEVAALLRNEDSHDTIARLASDPQKPK